MGIKFHVDDFEGGGGAGTVERRGLGSWRILAFVSGTRANVEYGNRRIESRTSDG